MKSHLGKIAIIFGFIASSTSAFAQTGGTAGCVIAGPSTASLTIEEYADFECPYCVRGANTMKQALSEYSGKIKLVYRNMPLAAHANALVAAKAFSAVCMQNPSLAYTFQNDLFANQSEFKTKGEPYLYDLANKIGVDVTQMKTDMAGPDIAKSIADDQAAATQHALTGTPSFMIGTEAVTGALPYSEIKKVIDRQLGN